MIVREETKSEIFHDSLQAAVKAKQGACAFLLCLALAPSLEVASA